MTTLYSQQLWDEYVIKVESDFKLKTYPHIDPLFNFVKDKSKLHKLVSDPSLKSIGSYPFHPFLKILKKTPRYRYHEQDDEYKLDTKIRPISFASHFDTYILGFYSFCLTKLYQKFIKDNGFDEVVLAYRSDLDGKCNIQFAKEAFDQIKSKIFSSGKCSAITLDIKGYFDHINHALLKKTWCKLLQENDLPKDQYNIYKTLTKYSYINYSKFQKHFNIDINKIEKKHKKGHPENNHTKAFNSILDLIPNDINGPSFQDKLNLLRNKKLIALNRNIKDKSFSKIGIPQGSAISSLLSNVYLLDFDKMIYEKGKKEDFIYRRYCDDILIICSPEKVNELINFIKNIITHDYKLTIQEKKTDVIDFKESLSKKSRGYGRTYNKNAKEFIEKNNKTHNFKNLQYLGFEFNGEKIYIRPGSLSRYFIKLKARIFKTVSMAYSLNSKSDQIFKKQIYSRYSHFGKRNFLTYALNAAKKYYFNSEKVKKLGMNSPAIKKQISRHIDILKAEIQKTSAQRASSKKAIKVLT